MSSQSKVRVIFACHPSIYSAAVLSHLLSQDFVHVLGVVESTCIKRRNASRLSDIKDLLRTSGLRYSLYLWFVTDLFALFNKLRRFGKRPAVSVSALCHAFKLPVFQTRDVNSSASHQVLELISAKAAQCDEAHEPIYFVTVMFNQKLSVPTLSLSGLRFINLHPGSLPGYRGIDPVLDALVNGDKVGEISLHKTEAELDAGDVLAHVEVPLDHDESLFANNYRFFVAGAEMLSAWLQRCLCEPDALEGFVQQGQARYTGWPRPTEVAKLKRLVSLLDRKVLFRRGHLTRQRDT